MAKDVEVNFRVIIFIALGFLLCGCGVKGDPKWPPSEINEGQKVSMELFSEE